MIETVFDFSHFMLIVAAATFVLAILIRIKRMFQMRFAIMLIRTMVLVILGRSERDLRVEEILSAFPRVRESVFFRSQIVFVIQSLVKEQYVTLTTRNEFHLTAKGHHQLRYEPDKTNFASQEDLSDEQPHEGS